MLIKTYDDGIIGKKTKTAMDNAAKMFNQTTTTPTTTTDNSKLIEDSYNQQLEAQKAALRQKINEGVSNYQNQINAAPQIYQPLRNQVDVMRNKNTAATREAMAASGLAQSVRGIGGSGDNITAGIQVNTEADSQINTLNLQQQNMIDLAKKAIADLQASGNMEEARMIAENAANRINAIIAEKNRVAEANRVAANDAWAKNMDVANITGYYNPYAGMQINPETAKYASNYQAEIDRRRATPDANDDALIPDLEAARAAKIFSNPEMLQKYGTPYKTQTARAQDFNNAVTVAGLTGIYNGKPTMESILNTAKMTGYYNGKPTLEKQQLDLNQQNWQREMTFKERQAQIENALSSGRLSIEQAQLALSQAKFQADNDPNSLDNQLKREQLNITKSSKNDTKLNNIIDNINKLYTYKDDLTGEIKTNPAMSQQLRNYIIGLNLPDNETDSLLLLYGLPIN